MHSSGLPKAASMVSSQPSCSNCTDNCRSHFCVFCFECIFGILVLKHKFTGISCKHRPLLALQCHIHKSMKEPSILRIHNTAEQGQREGIHEETKTQVSSFLVEMSDSVSPNPVHNKSPCRAKGPVSEITCVHGGPFPFRSSPKQIFLLLLFKHDLSKQAAITFTEKLFHNLTAFTLRKHFPMTYSFS